MNNLIRIDSAEIKKRGEKTPEGYIRAEAIATRTGIFVYKNPDGSERRELRHPDDVYKRDSLESLKQIPVTLDHPKEILVTAENAGKLAKGSVGENYTIDGEYIIVPLNITHKDAVEAVESGKVELSLGYALDLINEAGIYNGEAYTHRQKNIKYNHLAIVDRARAGGMARINMDTGETFNNDNEDTMHKVTLDNNLTYDAAPEVAVALRQVKADAEAAKKDAGDLQKQLDAMKEKLDKMAAERDSYKEKLDEYKKDAEKKNSDGFREAVKQRLTIERKAAAAGVTENLDGMSDLELMTAVVQKLAPKANLDGQSDVYIRGRFDAATDSLDFNPQAAQAAMRSGVATKTVANTDSKSALQAALEVQSNAWKKA